MADDEIIQDEVKKIVGGINQDLPGPSFETGDAATQACKAIVDEVFNFETLNPDKQLQGKFLGTLWQEMGQQYHRMAQTCQINTEIQQVVRNTAQLDAGTGTIGEITRSEAQIYRTNFAAKYRDHMFGVADRVLNQSQKQMYFRDLKSALNNLNPEIRNHLDAIDQMVASNETDERLYEENGTVKQTAQGIKDLFKNDPEHPQYALVMLDATVGGYIWRHPTDQTRQDAFKKSLYQALGPTADQLLKGQPIPQPEERF